MAIQLDAGSSSFRDTSLPLHQRASALMSHMTLEEKCAQLTYAAPGIERLGVQPHNWWNECLHGVGRAGLATVFPQAIGLAATFDTGLMHRVASAIADEARAKHHAHAARGDFGIYKGLSFWTPNINIFRDPRWGRGHETYGECPYLTGRMAVAFITGLQGDDPDYFKVIATAKHFAVHSGPETGRHSFDVHVSKQDLYETYLPAFRAAVVEAKAFSVMGAYNRLEGVPCCASDFLLNEILRKEWGFEGYTVSDCGAITDIHAHHKVTATVAESAALAVTHGLDMCCGKDFEHLTEALRLKLLSEADVERSLLRLLIARFKLGMFDPPKRVGYASIPYDVLDCPEHRELALQAARASIVLLKNEGGILPLAKHARQIAVIGPNADAPAVLLGNYHGTPPYIVTPLEAIGAAAGSGTSVTHVQGCTHLTTQGVWLGAADRGFVEAVIAAERADVTILCLGLTPTIEGEEGDAMNSEAGGDRTAIELPGYQQKLLEAIVATGKPIVLVLIAGSAVAVPFAQEKVRAIIQQFYPGQSGGTALAEVLFGDHNPSGRLPITVYRGTTDLPDFKDYAMAGRTYRYFEGKVLYPFGFGLSYTRFEYGRLTCATSNPTAGEPVRIEAKITNTGKIAGEEIAQCYIQHQNAPTRTPRFQLVGIKKLSLAAGESQTVQFTIDPRDLAITFEDGSQKCIPGTVRVWIGGSSPDLVSTELGAAISEPIAFRLA
jgi:beta-glucosidase